MWHHFSYECHILFPEPITISCHKNSSQISQTFGCAHERGVHHGPDAREVVELNVLQGQMSQGLRQVPHRQGIVIEPDVDQGQVPESGAM